MFPLKPNVSAEAGHLLPSIASYQDIWEAIRDIKPWQYGVLLFLWIVKTFVDGSVYSRIQQSVGDPT